jgi:hypothetical protein
MQPVMNKPFFKYSFLIIFFTLIACNVLLAQKDTTLRQEVEVIKAYKPTISDAYKINDIPTIKDEEFKKPVFDYTIYSQPVFSTFSINPLKAATIEGKPTGDSGLGLVKAGIGNYNKPYAELFFNNKQTKNTTFGMHFRHLSSHSNIKLPGGDKSKAPFSENNAEMFLKYFKGNSTLSMSLGFDRNGFTYYGYPVDTVPASVTSKGETYNYFGMKQAFSKGTFNISLLNTKPDPSLPTVGFNFTYNYFGAKSGQREHVAEMTTDIRKPFNSVTALLDLGATFCRASEIDKISTLNKGYRQQLWLTGKPAIYIGNKTANLTAGLNIWMLFDNIDVFKMRLAPNIKANFSPVRDLINIFAGIDGNYINNHYSKIAYENPFVNPTHDVKNTMERFRFYGGFDGKFSSKTNFKISADYALRKSQPFYYLFAYQLPTMGPKPGPTIIQNDFKILYDSLNILKFNAEVYHTATKKLDLLISADYYQYKTSKQEHAWNMPAFDAKISLGYKMTDQLSVSADLFVIGTRKALIVETIGLGNPVPLGMLEVLSTTHFKTYTMDAVIDMNFRAQYKINEKFSLFAQLNNFGFRAYQQWFGYPVQKMNFLAGLSYAF